MDGQNVTVRGVVSGDFQDGDADSQNELGGFFLQEENADFDSESSDGVFVFDGSTPATDVNVGDRVNVGGTVNEYFGETQITATHVEVTAAGAGVIPETEVNLPVNATLTNTDGALVADLEQYEGMLVRFPQTLTVTDLFGLERYGEILLSQGGRLTQYTNDNAPDVAGYAAHQDQIAARSIMLDDGLLTQNPDPIRYLNPAISATPDYSVRTGDTITGLTGTIRFSRGSSNSGTETYRLVPTVNPELVSVNVRPTPGPNVLRKIENSNPLRPGGDRYLQTTIIKNGTVNRRSERSLLGTNISDVQMTPLGVIDGEDQYAADNDWWYAFRMRMDRVDDTINGHYVQWHNEKNGPPDLGPPMALTGHADWLKIRLEANADAGGSDVSSPILVSNPEGTNRKYIFQIRWDTRSNAQGGAGLIKLYLDNDPTPVWTWNGQTAHPGPLHTAGRAPSFVWGLYKSLYGSQGVNGSTNIQSYDDFIEIEDDGAVQNMRASIAALMDSGVEPISPLMHWDNSTEVLGDLGEISGTMRTHKENSASLVRAEDMNPLRFGGGRYLQTTIVKNGTDTHRSERHPIGTYIADITMSSLGGGQYASTNDWWYAFRMRIDRVDDDVYGIYAQWHDQTGTTFAPIWLEGRGSLMRIVMTQNRDNGGSHIYSPALFTNIERTNKKYIFRIRWDTRSNAEGGSGLLELYLDNDATPVWTWHGQTAHDAPSTTGRAPNFKYGLYKSLFSQQGTAGDTNIQSYDDFIEAEADRPVADMRASIAALMDNVQAEPITPLMNWDHNSEALGDAGAVTGIWKISTDDNAPNVGGTLKVASFNVLNYFTTIDTGQSICGPTGNSECRGADSQEEFDRQHRKIINALLLLDADIVGLMELENNASASLQRLVADLNTVAGAGTYAFVDTGTIGSGAIRVGFLYKPASVSTTGAFAVLTSNVDQRFDDSRNRPVLVQSFAQNSNGAVFTVAVNHLMSKGSNCNSGGDPDLNDGQGSCNVTRSDAAAALADWLATDPTSSGDPDILIIGDLNAYLQEDPITILEDAGFNNLVETFLGSDSYSFLFAGEAGALDHALGSQSLLVQVAGVMDWHINADEPAALDYNLDFGRNPGIFDGSTPYRASDHDPLIIGLDLN